MQHRVFAYITRNLDGRRELLVFTHRDFPEAGIQVPAGTVEPGEPIETALFRETEEESGLRSVDIQLVRKLAEHESQEWKTIRHVYHLAAIRDLPRSWAHSVRGHGEDAGLVFNYYWADINTPPMLAGEQGQWLMLLNE